MLITPARSFVAAGTELSAPAISIRGLTKKFADKTIFERLDLDVEHGQAVALIGANGTGKSTLLKCLLRLVEPTAGSVGILGEEITGMNPKGLRLARARVGMVWQKHNLVPRHSALTNVIHGAQSHSGGPRTWLQSLAPDGLRTEALTCLEKVGLADRALQRVDSLSGGQSQRVAIARTLMQRPKVVLADEPDASLDPRSGDEVMVLLSNLARQEGLTLVFVSHRIEHTIRYADRIVGLRGGGIALDAKAESTNADALNGFFDGGATH